MLVKAGSTLLVPRSEQRQTDVPVAIADNAVMALAPDLPPLRKLSLKAGRRDSVASVAKRYKVDAVQVAQWNSVNPAFNFKPGQTIVVFVANKGKATRTAHGKTATHSADARTATAPHKATGKASHAAKHGKAVRVARS